MRKLRLAVLGGTWLTFLWAAPALAGSELPEPEVLGQVIRPTSDVLPGGLAFTGSGGNIRLWMVLVAVLLVAGVALLIATRRRRAAATE